jgi:hypothetical protein
MLFKTQETAERPGHVVQHPENCSFSELYKKEGWTVPGLAGAKAGKRAQFQNIPGVFVTILKPNEPEATITEIRCSQTKNGRIEIEERPIGILDLRAIDFNGKLFAYGLTYGKEVIENGQRHSVAAATSIIIYDTDGSGKFTLRSGSDLAIWPITVPDWVRKVSESK